MRYKKLLLDFGSRPLRSETDLVRMAKSKRTRPSEAQKPNVRVRNEHTEQWPLREPFRLQSIEVMAMNAGSD